MTAENEFKKIYQDEGLGIAVFEKENYAVFDLLVYTIIQIPKSNDHWEQYKWTARKLIDIASQEESIDGIQMGCNNIGITRLLGALVWVVHVENYYGEGNRRYTEQLREVLF